MIQSDDVLVRPFSVERQDATWMRLNHHYFHGLLPPIDIEWSQRLTASAGMFLSRVGPRAKPECLRALRGPRRLIRLSIPLLHDQSEEEIVGTLAHEMIHQWQYDVLRRRPDHGADFCRMMAVMNRDGLGITIRHSLDDAIKALARYTWRCQQCGRDYHRHRRTIRPSQHRCGACHGRLREIELPGRRKPPASPAQSETDGFVALSSKTLAAWAQKLQLRLPFW